MIRGISENIYMDRLINKVSIITGGAKGIGAATAELLSKEGCCVLITDILDDVGIALANKLPNCDFFHLEVSNEENWKECFCYCMKKFGKVDILFNNAGIMGTSEKFGLQDPENASFESWKIIHEINLNSVFFGCKLAIKYMKNSGGSIINMSSRSGIVGVPTSVAYASSKAAIRNFTKSVALYCANKNYKIRCNSIHPAAIKTDIWSHMIGNGSIEDQNKVIKSIESGIPLGKMGTPTDVANLVLFLASDESAFMTGSEVIIDGGILAGSSCSPKC